MTRSSTHPATLSDLAGADLPLELGVSEWIEVSQDRIDRFAEVTEDHQWIHVDPEQAADGPFGTTVAHGLLTLALVPRMLADVLSGFEAAEIINRGVRKATFRAPVPSGSRIRGTLSVVEAEFRGPYLQIILRAAFECDAAASPGSADLILLTQRD